MVFKPLVQYGLMVLLFLAFGTLLPDLFDKQWQDFSHYKISVILIVFISILVNQKRMQKTLVSLTALKDDFNEVVEATKMIKVIPILLLANFFNYYYLGNNLFILLMTLNIVIAAFGYSLTKKITRYEFLEEIKHREWDFEVEDVSKIIDVIKSLNQEEFKIFSRDSYVLTKALKSKQKESLIKLLKDMYRSTEFKDYKYKAKKIAIALNVFLFDNVIDFINEGFTIEDLDCNLTYARIILYVYEIKEDIGLDGVKMIMENLENQSKFREFKIELSKSYKDTTKRNLLELELIAKAAEKGETKGKTSKI